MNKLKLKKLLTLLVCLMLVVTALTFAACNPDDGNTDPVTETPVTRTPSVSNGNFATATSADAYPYTPTSWTGGPTTLGDGFPALKTNTVAGVISLNADTYNANKSNWGDLPVFDKYTEGLDENYTDDDNVLMIYNKEPSFYYYKSSQISAAAGKYYKLTIDVKTANLGGGADKGVNLYLVEYSTSSQTLRGSTGVAQIEKINVDTWTRYTFYIKGKVNNSTSLMLIAALGTETTDTANASLTSGYAFFDNINFTALTNEDESAYDDADFNATLAGLDAAANNLSVAVNLGTPNANFDYLTSDTGSKSSPAKYSAISTSTDTVSYGRIDLSGTTYDASCANIDIDPAVVANPGFADEATIYNKRPQYAYAINAKATAGNVVGFRLGTSSSDNLIFSRGKAYKVSVMVNTQYVTSGKAYVALTEGTTTYTSSDLAYEISQTAGWKEYSFVVLANQNNSLNYYLQLWLGYGEDKATGVAFFDSLQISELDLTGKDFADLQAEVLTGVDVGDYAKYSVDKTTKYDASLINNGFFIQNAADGTLIDASVAENDAARISGWKPVYDDGATDKLNGVNNSAVTYQAKKVTADNGLTTPYASVSDYVLEVKSEVPTVFGLEYNTKFAAEPALIEELQPLNYYRFSMWIKTVDVPTSSGVTLTVYDGRSNADRVVLGTAFSTINTATAATDDINGYRELVFYIHTNTDVQELSFELRFGSGGQYSEGTLFSGTAYIANVSLLPATYSDYDSASTKSTSNTNIKIKDFATSASGSFANDQFENYDYDKVAGLDTGGIVENEFSASFGVPSGWDYVSANLMTDAKHVYRGIVDVDRTGLIANLKNTAAINRGTAEAPKVFSGLANFDFAQTSLFYNPAKGADKDEYTYSGEHSALMLAALDQTYDDTDNTKDKNFVNIGYTTSSTIKLDANAYYEISVLVKTVESARASVYLTTDNNASETNDNTKFENISTTAETAKNGWKKYTFRVKVGFSAINVNLGLYLGWCNDPSVANAAGASTGGIVFFDVVTKTPLTAEQYDAEIGETVDNVKKVELTVDSFGLSSNSEHASNSDSYLTPLSGTWTANSLVTTDGSKHGIVINRDELAGGYNFTDYGTDPFNAKNNLRTVLTGKTGNSALVIYNAGTGGAYNYTMTSTKTFSKDSYYKITVYGKTWGVAEGSKAYAKLTVTNYNDSADDNNVEGGSNIIYFNTGYTNAYQQFTFYVKTPATKDDSKAANITVKLSLGLGEVNGDEQTLVSGFAIFDDVEITALETTTDADGNILSADYTAALSDENANTEALAYKTIVSTEVEPEPEPSEGDTDDTKNYNWIIFTSVAFGALIIIAVAAFFIKKYLPKKKAKAGAPADKKPDKDKEDKYKDLKD